jgi:hypothetical protein
MRLLRALFLLPLFLAVASSVGFDQPASTKTAKPDTKEDTKPAPAVPGFEASLEDSSVVHLTLLQEQVQVTTPYGVLKVPVRDIQGIDFGQRISEASSRRIRSAIEQLASKTPADRAAAGSTLLELGPASFAALRDAAGSADREVVRRAQTLLTKLEAKYSKQRLQRKHHDLVHTPTFTIAGRVEGTVLKIRTPYFGEKELKLADVVSLRSTTAGTRATLVVAAARYALPGQGAWMETAVRIRPRTRLQVTATGQIDLYPQPGGASTYVSGPGGAKWGRGFAKGTAMPQGQTPGTLLGRIGKSGKEFVVGEKYEGTPGEDGLLHLRIVGSPWNNNATGEYRVVIATR